MIFKLLMIVSLNTYTSDLYVIDQNLTRDDCIQALIEVNKENTNKYVSYECLGEE